MDTNLQAQHSCREHFLSVLTEKLNWKIHLLGHWDNQNNENKTIYKLQLNNNWIAIKLHLESLLQQLCQLLKTCFVKRYESFIFYNYYRLLLSRSLQITFPPIFLNFPPYTRVLKIHLTYYKFIVIIITHVQAESNFNLK